jgi:hypothetical protein
MATKGTMTPTQTIAEMIAADPILQFLANGGSWADAVEMDERMQEERRAAAEVVRLAAAVEAIPKWEGQLEAVVRKGSKTPSALAHKARLLASLREAYAHAGRDPSTADAYLARVEAVVASAAAAKAAKEEKKGGAAPKGKNAWSALVDSDDD